MVSRVAVTYEFEFTEEWVAKCGLAPRNWRAMDPGERAQWMIGTAMEWIEGDCEPTSIATVVVP